MSTTSLSFYFIIKVSLLILFIRQCATKCPSTGDSSSDSEINADCICDSNLSLTTNFEHLPAKQRTSIQCSQVDFIQLLKTLKQTASVYYPPVLQASAFESSRQQQSNHIHLTRKSSDGDNEDILHVLKALRDPQEVYRARLLFASSAKLDLVQVSNSTIIKLTNFMFVSNFSYLYNQKRINDDENDNASKQSINKNVDEDVLDIDDGKKMNNIVQVTVIQSLHLSRCGIDTIEEFAFAGLEFSLASLSLTNNKLSSIPSLALNNLIALKLLDLTNNNILSLNAFAFNNLHKLNTLRLADNNLGTITPSIDVNAFEGLGDSLIDLSLKNCKLNFVPTNSFSAIINLEFLNLAQNNITTINANSFKPLKALSTLNLERNNIRDMDKASFAGIEISLSSLSLLANNISDFPSYQMKTLRQLRRLDLGFNKLTELPLDAFTANSQLLLVALDGNELKTLPESAFTSVRNSLKGLSFGGKSIVCDCKLEWLVRWQAFGQLQVSSRERDPQFCAQPFRLRSLASFSNLNKELQNCNSKTDTLEKSNSNRKEMLASSSSHLPSGGLTTVSDIYSPTTLDSRVTVDDDDLISAASTIKSYGQSSIATTTTTTMRPSSSMLQTQKATRSQYGSRVATDVTMGLRFQDRTTQPTILKLAATTIMPRDDNKNEGRVTQKPSHQTTMSTVFQTTATAQPSRITTQQVANQYSPEYRNQSTQSITATTTSKIQHYIDMKNQRKVSKNGPSDSKLTILDKNIAKSQTVAPRFEDKFTFIPTTMLPQTTTTKMPQTTRQSSKLYNTQQPQLKLISKNNTISTSTVRMQITEPVKFTIIKDQNKTKDITLKELKTLTDDNSFGSYVASSSPSIIRTLPPFSVPQPTSKIGSANEIQVDVDTVSSRNNSTVLPGNRIKDTIQPRISFSVSSSSISAKPSSSFTSSATTTSIGMNKNIAKSPLEKTVSKLDNQQTNNSRMSVSSMTRLMSLPIAVDQINASFSTTEKAMTQKEQSNHPTVELERLSSTPSVTLLSTSYITPNLTTISRDLNIKKKRIDDSDSKPSLKTSSDILRLGVDPRLMVSYNTSRLNTEFDSHKLNLSQISSPPLKLTTLKPAGSMTTTSTTTSTTSTTTSSPSYSDELDQRSIRAFYNQNSSSSLGVDTQDLISTQIHAQEVLKTNTVNETANKGKQQNSLLSRHRGQRKEDEDYRDSSLPEIAATTTAAKDDKRLLDVGFANLPPFFNKLSRVVDVDKLALILATVLCAALLLIALTTICICCCCWQSSTGSQTKRKTLSSSVGKNLTPFSDKLTVKRNTKRQTMSSSKAMSNSLLLQSDDTGDSNSSSASCMHVQMPLQQTQTKERVSNKRINERLPTRSASLLLVPGKARAMKGTISPKFEPLDHADGLRRHIAAHEQLNTASSKPLFTTNLAGNSKMVKRSHSLAIENRLHPTKHNLDPETCSSELSSSSSLSCDSDKTNSPGANKNNHYNLSAAHKNFLVNNQTTDERSTCDLLQTIDEHGSEPQFKYSSQTKRQVATNDSRGKVSLRKSLVKSSQYQPPAPPPPPPLPPIPVSQPNTTNLALLQFVSNYPNIVNARLSPLPTESLNGDYLSTELLPISAEDHWPSEPHADPSGVPNSLTYIGNHDNFTAQPADNSDDDERNRQDEFLNDSHDKCWSSRQNKFNLDANWHTMAPHKSSSTPSNKENCTHMNCSIIHCSDYYTQPNNNHTHNERNSYMSDLNLLSPLPPRKLQHSQSTHRHRHKRNNHSHHQHSYNHNHHNHHQHHKQNKKNDESNHPASIHSQNQDSNLASRQTYGAVNWLRWAPPPPPSMQQLHYDNN